jgi:hypothetical protein
MAELRRGQGINELLGDYISRFTEALRVVTRDHALDEIYKMDYFIEGLEASLGYCVRKANPANLAEAIRIAKREEEARNELLRKTTVRTDVDISKLEAGTNNDKQNIFQKSEQQVNKDMEDMTNMFGNMQINTVMEENNRLLRKNNKLRERAYNRQNNRMNGPRPGSVNYDNISCYNCRQKEYYATICPQPKVNRGNNNRRVNLAEYDYDDGYNGEFECNNFDNGNNFEGDEFDEDNYEVYYQDRGIYPVQTRSNRRTKDRVMDNERERRRNDQWNTQFQKAQNVGDNDGNLNDVIMNETPMNEKPKRTYVPKGQGKYRRELNKFEIGTEEYNIVDDMKQMKPNINLAQLIKLNPRIATELANATRYKRVSREQDNN